MIAVLALRLAACGGNPAAPSGDVTLEGTVVEGQGTGRDFVAANDRGTTATAAVITVSVAENHDLSTTVSGGRFSLRGLPAGSFTLTFRSNGRHIGDVPFADVVEASTISVTVAVSPSSVSLVSDQRHGGGQPAPQAPQPGATPGATCMINGGRLFEGIELEGRVATGAYPTFRMNVNGNRASGRLVDVLAASATVQCSPASGPNAPTVEQCRAKVSGNQRIHVRGTLQTCTPTDALVMASRVIVQGN